MKTCAVSGCVKKHYAKGFCEKHYSKNRLYGNPHGGYEKRHRDGEGCLTRGYRKTQIDKVSKFEHVRIAEQVLGRTLPTDSVVHHVNENKSDNRNSNLVICPDNAYHNLLHRRMRALDECGNADWLRCPYCKTYDDRKNLIGTGRYWRHRVCRNEYRRHLYQQEK